MWTLQIRTRYHCVGQLLVVRCGVEQIFPPCPGDAIFSPVGNWFPSNHWKQRRKVGFASLSCCWTRLSRPGSISSIGQCICCATDDCIRCICAHVWLPPSSKPSVLLGSLQTNLPVPSFSSPHQLHHFETMSLPHIPGVLDPYRIHVSTVLLWDG